MTLLIALVLTAAPPPPALRRADLEFTDAVETFARTSRRGSMPPEPFRSLLRDLGSRCYQCRTRASGELRTASRDDPRWLMWGRHDRDPEVRLRSNNLLRDLTRCPECYGGGWCVLFRTDQADGEGPCSNCGQWAWNHFDSPRECWACGGEGYGWIKGAFDP